MFTSALYFLSASSSNISLPPEQLGGGSHVIVTQESKKEKDLNACLPQWK